MSVSDAFLRHTLPAPTGAPGVWAEWAGRRYGLLQAVAAVQPDGVAADTLAQATGFEAQALDLWLRLAYAHGLLLFDSALGYALTEDMAAAVSSAVLPVDPADWGSYPPPFRLSCDLAMILRLVPAEAAARWAAVPVWSFFGRVPLIVLVARYRSAETGSRLLSPPPGLPYLYQEVSCLLPAASPGSGGYTFPALWVDSIDALPIELGWRYGFPKYPASVRLVTEGRAVITQAADREGDILDVRAGQVAPLPARAVAAVAVMRAVFPASGFEAVLRLESIHRAWLLALSHFQSARLDALGLTGPCLGGLWLEGVQLYLSEPLA